MTDHPAPGGPCSPSRVSATDNLPRSIGSAVGTNDAWLYATLRPLADRAEWGCTLDAFYHAVRPGPGQQVDLGHVANVAASMLLAGHDPDALRAACVALDVVGRVQMALAATEHRELDQPNS